MKKVAKFPILVRWPNEETGGWFRIPGLIVSRGAALVVFEEHLEVHLVAPTSDPNEFDLRYASNPIFRVGDDLPTIFHDIANLTVAEFAGKYTHPDFFDPAGAPL